jgi:hypothetical protein
MKYSPGITSTAASEKTFLKRIINGAWTGRFVQTAVRDVMAAGFYQPLANFD